MNLVTMFAALIDAVVVVAALPASPCPSFLIVDHHPVAASRWHDLSLLDRTELSDTTERPAFRTPSFAGYRAIVKRHLQKF